MNQQPPAQFINPLSVCRAIPEPPQTDVELDSVSKLSLSASSSLSTTSTLDSENFKRFRRRAKDDDASPSQLEECERAIATQNVDELALIARTRGIPPMLRRVAWRMLLSNRPGCQEPSFAQESPAENELKGKIPYKRIDGDIKRMKRRLRPRRSSGSQSSDDSSSTVSNESILYDDEFFETIRTSVVCFLEKWANFVAYESAMLWTAITMSQVLGYAIEADFYEPALISLLSKSPKESVFFGPSGRLDSDTAGRIFDFCSIFRTLLPELAAYFDSEGIPGPIGGDEWLIWWIKYYGVRSFAPMDLARLWDIYFGWRPDSTSPFEGNPAPPEMHMFVCIAMMKSHASKLMDLDQSEIRQFLSRVPASKSIEKIIAEGAVYYKEYQSSLLETPVPEVPDSV